MIIDWGKLSTFLAAIVGVTVLAGLRVVSGEAATGLYLVVMGYVAGNGRLAAKGLAPQPMIRTTRDLRAPSLPIATEASLRDQIAELELAELAGNLGAAGRTLLEELRARLALIESGGGDA